jgi:hypothetical protein
MHGILKVIYRPVVAHSARQIMAGRLIDRSSQQRGRFTRAEVDRLLRDCWVRLDQITTNTMLKKLPTLGARHNRFLAALTLSAYHSFIASGIPRDYAIELAADVGWKVYLKLLWLPRLVSRLVTRDPQRRINFILRMFMRFPFRGSERPGYEVKAWAEPSRYCTDWTYCPPLALIKDYIAVHGDQGELEAFQKSWCGYDWALPAAMLDGGDQPNGHYERPHTMSHGDNVCDMRWYANTPDADSIDIAAQASELRQ